MNRREHEIVIRRILVALDASPHSQAALDAAAQLAAQFSAELRGLFVEDVNLLRLAELPFAHEVSFWTARRRRVDGEDLERQLRAQARRVRQRLMQLAERGRLRWSFRVVRGVISSELLEASSEVDLIILGRSGWSVHRRRRIGSTARAVVQGAPVLTLVLQKDCKVGLPVMVVYDGSSLANKALAAGAILAQSKDGPVTVVSIDSVSAVEQLREEASARLEALGVEGQYRSLTRSSVDKLLQLIQVERCGTLVLPAKSALLEEEALLVFLEEVEVPTLFVR